VRKSFSKTPQAGNCIEKRQRDPDIKAGKKPFSLGNSEGKKASSTQERKK